jgi:hypothetical protein
MHSSADATAQPLRAAEGQESGGNRKRRRTTSSPPQAQLRTSPSPVLMMSSAMELDPRQAMSPLMVLAKTLPTFIHTRNYQDVW